MTWDDFERMLCWMVVLANDSTLLFDDWCSLIIQMADRWPARE
jgi:hypothetical protein